MKNKETTIFTISLLAILILTISLVISISYNIKNLHDNDRKKQAVFSFFLTYVNEIKDDIQGLENCRSKRYYKNFNEINNNLLNHLYSLNQLLSDAYYLVILKNYYISTSNIFQQIGFAIDGKLMGNVYQGRFTEDGILSDNELKFVRQLLKDLESFSAAIVGKDKLNVNPKLTDEDFSNALQTFSDKWTFYNRPKSEFSPYDYLKRK